MRVSKKRISANLNWDNYIKSMYEEISLYRAIILFEGALRMIFYCRDLKEILGSYSLESRVFRVTSSFSARFYFFI